MSELDPKLRDFEAQLRRLKPLNVLPPRPLSLWERVRERARVAVCAATAATVLAIVCLTPQRQPPTMIEPVEWIAVTASEKLPTMRQQLAQLLGEINTADAVPEKTPVYPVVEITVCETEVRRQELGVRRWEHTKFDLLLSPEF